MSGSLLWRHTPWPLLLAAAGAALVALTLGYNFWLYLHLAADAVRYPYELDYGEGIVWQQAALIPGPRMYGSITEFPYLVFHYPPLYHLAANALALNILGGDWLAAGRTVSVVSTLAIAGLLASLAAQGTPGWSRSAAAAVAGLLVFTLFPVMHWSRLARVDMLALAFGFSGVLLVALSFKRPGWLYPAVLLFVAAVFTKQTAVAAPAAALLVSFLREPRHTVQAGLLGLAASLAALAALQEATGGGFLRHIVSYNINRYSVAATVEMVASWSRMYGPYLILTAMSVVLRWQGVRLPGLVALIRNDRMVALSAVLTLYLLFATSMLATAGKTGASWNYFIEWMCLWCIWIGLLVGQLLPAAPRRPLQAVLLCAVLLCQCWLTSSASQSLHADTSDVALLQQHALLLEEIRATPGPVLSDDMVVLMQTGKGVPLEPSIFAELASTGAWDETPFLSLLQSQRFGAVLTYADPGGSLYEARYTPAVRAAIAAAYPRVEAYGPYRLRLPH